MYTPPAYAEPDTALLHRRMREWSFATLITCGEDGPNATHLPFLLDGTQGPHGRLTTHMARANRQLRDLQQGAQALVVFQGPHAFISPSWYENRMTFPTWNYTAIHARGPVELVEDPQAIHAVLQRTVATYDTPVGGAWRFDAMPVDFTASRLRNIVALHIPIARLEGKMKLNQDKSPADQAGVIAALEAAGSHEQRAVAALMRELQKTEPAHA